MRLGIIALSLLVTACSNKPLKLSPADSKNTSPSGLIRIENSQKAFSYAKPNVDWSKYTHIHVAKVTANNAHPENYKAPRIDPMWDGHKATYDIPDEGLRRLENEFIKMAKNIFDNEQAWQYSDTITDTTIVISAVITDIRLTAPVETSRRSRNINGKTYTQNAGSMVLKAVLSDGESGQILVKSIDNAQANENWSLNTRAFNLSDVRTIYRSWGNALKNAMYQVHNTTQKD